MNIIIDIEEEKRESIERKRDDEKESGDEGNLIANINKLCEKLRNEKDGEHDILIGQLFSYCLKRFKEEKKLEYMMMVAALLPHYASDSYESLMAHLKEQLTYIKFPPEFLDIKQNRKFTSTREHLWSYKFQNYKFSVSNLDKFSVPGLPRFGRLHTSFHLLYVT